MCSMTLVEPALHPAMVTRPGSPPKALMFLCTHFNAATWSFIPLLPGASSSPVLRKPGNEEAK